MRNKQNENEKIESWLIGLGIFFVGAGSIIIYNIASEVIKIMKW